MKPQAPQLNSSFVISAQLVPFGPHAMEPALHTQAPDTHMPAGPHFVPQTPQLFGSFDRFAQVFC